MKNYRLGHRLNIVGRLHAKRLLAKIIATGLTSSQWPVIAHLMYYGASTQVKIAEQLAIEPPSISKTLDNMEMMGWIVRVADTDDKRGKKVMLTDKAKQIIPCWLQSIDEMQKQFLRGIPAEEIEVFDRVLGKMTANLSEKNFTG